MTASVTSTTEMQQSPRKRLNAGRFFVYFALILGLSMTLAPFLWMILGSFKTSSELIRIPPTFWPENPTIENYRTLINDPKLPLLRFYGNSAFVATFNVITNLFTIAKTITICIAIINIRKINFPLLIIT